MFRRRKQEVADLEATEATEATEDLDGLADPEAAASGAPQGPWDAADVDLEHGPERVDLGSLLVTPREGLDVQLQVDQGSGEVVAALIAGPEGAAELRAFAAPRNGDIWDDVRTAISAEVAQLGGTATEREGVHGTELAVAMTVQLDDGRRGQQPSRVVGISGPRWLLRVTFFGRPAVEYDDQGDVEQAVRDVVVVRGSGPVPPGDALPLTMPPQARRVDS